MAENSEITKPHGYPVTVTHRDALPAGTRLGEFEVLSLLGVGGFGMVYHAFDHSLERQVAIKEYMPSSLAERLEGTSVSMRSSGDVEAFDAGLRSFMAEARLLAQFDHPSLVKVFRFWEANKTAYMVMPLYRGITLKEARKQMHRPPSEQWLRKVMWSMLSALKVLHDAKTTHRDVSPDNIFLQDAGPPVLLDLGAARRTLSDKTQKYTAILKINYAPIEQYGESEDMRQGPWTDLYALAAVMHGCLTNEPPVPATFRVLKDRLPSMQDVAKTVQEQFSEVYSPTFCATLDHALKIRPEDRPQSTLDFEQSLELEAPVGMRAFDWRSELGENWIRNPQTTSADSYLPTQLVGEPHQRTQVMAKPEAQTVATTVLDRSQGRTVQYTRAAAAAPVIAAAAPNLPSPEVAGRKTGVIARAVSKVKAKTKRQQKQFMFAGTVLASLFLGGVIHWASSSPSVSRAPQEEMLIETMIQPKEPVASASSPVTGVAAAGVAMVALGQAAKTSPAALTTTAPKLSASAAKASGAGAKAAATASAAKATVVSNAPNVQGSNTTSASSAQHNAPTHSETRRSADRPRDAAHVGHEAATPKPAPVTQSDASLCSENNFLTRPMCIHNECQKPQNARLAVCIENNTKYRDQIQQQNPAAR
jgi:serine/threonine protein kinase